MKRTRYIQIFTLMLAVLLIVAGCGNKPASEQNGAADTTNTAQDSNKQASKNEKEDTKKPSNSKNPIVTIEMESGDSMEIELYPDKAPNTVNNFISLVNKGFYDGTIFHRVIPGFMIQGGDPQGIGIGGPGYSIKGEFSNNGVENDLKHTEGVLSMARSQDPNSAGSQFFIMVADAPHLDGDYAAFGKVIKGMETAQAIVNVPKGADDKPEKEQKMKKVTVNTFGITYPEPEKTQN
ncbi:peptidylprolyl isomerase [Paenibacillus alvei]|uniref:Peptidyl-prolyl cis-trans isomerase n=2 Tax=Paenibacillus TaxID=44249 RepID=A0ABT4GY77_PAEAL|nr:peptidylprolyl isomerase [Paenibacillus alvei]MCY7483011.1 peptidylprolyl isomerase [Paenibacillus alvei]MCY9544829.1 peptidylprolyl isomerase [Paenibacillus alvei]MCY9704461.1 peptidylprolyl isomerase [Paenibacillus alvei]MCY9732878.1 peptidylprolyl isomerase [Paenibacillus alvei]MCY9754802.1 peptidylprolyl isomerase [Paenibacillus alvei]